jgi:hypothetical protein
MPIFHMVLAPIFGLIGDRPTILFWLRFILLPLYFVAAWCTYRLGTLLFSRRAGIWAAIFVSFYPGYHFVSLEFRPDIPWAICWLLSLIYLIDQPITARRALAAGILLGLSCGISMKSLLLLAAILVAAPLAFSFQRTAKPGNIWKCLGAFLLGTILIPLTIIVFFAAKGVWSDFRYCNFDHNFFARFDNREHAFWMFLIFPLAFPLVLYGGRLIARLAPDPVRAFRRSFIFLICGFYLFAPYSVWIFVTRQNFLPYHPLAFVLAAGALLAFSDHVAARSRSIHSLLSPVPLLTTIAAIELLVCVMTKPFWQNKAAAQTQLLRGILLLTDSNDFVFNGKGETIFRQRCFRPVMEGITLACIRRGLVRDDVPERCVETQTCVANMTERLSNRARDFVLQNYLPVGSGLRVVGCFLQPSAVDQRHHHFEVTVPASYQIVAHDNSPVTGLLDGIPYEGKRFLQPGKHSFVRTSAAQPLALLWSKAVERNFTPFGTAASVPET